MNNLGLLFYKEYFKGIEFKSNGEPEITFNNSDLFSASLDAVYPPINTENKTFPLTTLYPGLLIGSGYAHEIGGFEQELKLGFFFDHTTGLPCIPGSSVKGVLRDAAEKANGHYLEYILSDIKDGKRILKDDATKEMAEAFLKDNKEKLLGGANSEFVKTIFEGENLSVYKKDIFFDAFPIASGNENGQFLDNDYITHHELPLKNPNPVQFLKVLPQVTFRFEFKLSNEIMDVELKLELFRQILLDLGLGAKTNVGYGQFIDCENLFKDFVELSDVNTGDEIECEIGEIVFRDNDNKYQVYLKPKIKNYPEFLRSLNKPFPSIRVEKHLISDIENSLILICKVKSIADDKRVMFDTKYKLK